MVLVVVVVLLLLLMQALSARSFHLVCNQERQRKGRDWEGSGGLARVVLQGWVQKVEHVVKEGERASLSPFQPICQPSLHNLSYAPYVCNLKA